MKLDESDETKSLAEKLERTAKSLGFKQAPEYPIEKEETEQKQLGK